MKRLIVAISLVVIVACSGTKPPKPPAPPPAEVCGNGNCVLPETNSTCPADCKVEPPPPPDLCGNGKCDAGEKTTCPTDCPVVPPPPPVDKVKDKSRIVMYGQYVETNNPNIDWEFVMKSLYESKYNAFNVHLMSPWGTKLMPFVLEGSRYNLDKDDEAYYENIKQMFHWAGVYDISIEICFFDRYFESKYISMGANKIHPFRENNKGFNWGADAHPLCKSWDKTGTNDSDFAWVKWITKGVDLKERVIDYKIVGKAGPPIHRILNNVLDIIVEEKAEHPGMDTVFIRYFNESYIRYTSSGHEEFCGETKILEIIQLLAQKKGLKHGKGKDFVMVDDGAPIQRVDIGGGKMSDRIVIKEWLKAWKIYLPMYGWYHELHGMDARQIKDLMAYSANFPEDMQIFSTDGLRPEDSSFTGRVQDVYRMKDVPNIDLKVPSELSPQRKNDFMFNFKSTFPVMEKFTKQ